MRLGVVVLSVFGFLANGAYAESPIPERRLSLTQDVDFSGSDIQSIFDTSLDSCQTACLSNTKCQAFTFNVRSNSCFMKSDMGAPTSFAGAFSGLVLTATPESRTIAKIRAADLTEILQDYDLAAAREQALDLTNKHIPGDATAVDLMRAASQARATGKTENAYRFAGAAVVVSDAVDHWLEYARLARSINTNNDDDRAMYREWGFHAAINAYLRAEPASLRAEALSILGEALVDMGRGSKAIPALRLAQSLDPRSGTEAILDQAIAQYGFRIVDNTVDNDSARPRICVEFSDNLVQAGVDYSPFVQVPSADLTVEADQRQLCVEGVVHGERYRVAFREGLPAATGETLAKTVTLDLYVRDRSPGVRFPGRAYILPASGDIALPIESVNLTSVDLILRKVSERSILRSIQEGFFGRPLAAWEAERFGDDFAAKVWEGTGEVGNDLNRDVVTRLPMAEVVGTLTPGIYALQASVPDADPYETASATQWFVVSDLGLATVTGTDGLHVFARALGSADPAAGVEITLLSRANAELAKTTTDAMGYAVFDAGFTLGTGGASPAMVVAKTADDLTFLSLTEPEFDLSDRGVEGRAAAGPVDAFMTTDRGAYRAGETVNATVLVRDDKAEAIENLPLVAVLIRPDGVEYSRQQSTDSVAGGHVFAFQTSAGVPRGSWRLDVHADPDAPAIATTKVLLEDFLPERIEFDLALPDGVLSAEDITPLGISAKYLFGAPAGELPVEGETNVRTTRTLDTYPGYQFGRYDEDAGTRVTYFEGGTRTDEDGAAVIDLALEVPTDHFRPMEAVVAVRLSEGSGRPVERKITRAIAPNGPVIGIKPNFEDTLAENTQASFSLIALDGDQKKTEMQVHWTVNRVETRYQWFQYSGSWDWEPITVRTRVKEGDAKLGEEPITVEAPVEWGRYEIKVERKGGDYVAASTEFNAGWYGGGDVASTPDILQASLDAETYNSGDTAKLRLVPRYAGKALITVVSNRLIDMKAVDVVEGENLVELPVTDDWGTGAYVTATVIRPMDASAGRNPARALGLSYAKVDPSQHKLAASFEMPTEIDPRGPMPVVLKVEGIAPGETAFATFAAVDVGILNLTAFQSPDPAEHYFGQRKLGVGMRDVYGRLIDGMNGTMGLIRSGGDASNSAGLKAPPPTEELVAYFSGPIQVDDDGYARTEFTLPSFNGTVRLMAVVWSNTAVGQAETDVLVRDPVVVTASLPRFMAPRDTSRLLLEMVHATGPAGAMELVIKTQGLEVDASMIPANLTLAEQGKEVISIPITAREVGIQTIEVALTTPDGKSLTKTLTLPVQINDPETSRTSRFQLASGDSFTFDQEVFSGYRSGTASATLAAGPIARLDAPGLLEALDRYPYGCTEQVTSRALPLLYLDEVARALGLEQGETLALRIDQAIEKVLTNQASSGAFGLWRAESGDFWLDAYVSDFLSRARTAGYAVPDNALASAMDNLRNRINYASDFEDGGEDIAYALYVLAREGAASVGDLRYYADVKGNDFGSPLAAAQIGAALAAYGDPVRADRMFARAATQIAALPSNEARIWRSDYGTHLRDTAAVLTLAVEAGSTAVNRDTLLNRIAAVDDKNTMSTQEQVWSLLATRALVTDAANGDLTINGVAVTGPLVKVAEDDTAFDALNIQNRGDKPAIITLTSFGVPEVPEPAGGNGFAIERAYYSFQGDAVSLDTVASGTRLVAVLTVKPFFKTEARLMIDDPLPAGFEIDNPNLMRGGDVGALDWLDLNSDVQNAEFRQERFLAAVNWQSDKEFRLGYVVRAISPGIYHHPAASVEDMYRPQFRAHTDSGQLIVTE